MEVASARLLPPATARSPAQRAPPTAAQPEAEAPKSAAKAAKAFPKAAKKAAAKAGAEPEVEAPATTGRTKRGRAQGKAAEEQQATEAEPSAGPSWKRLRGKAAAAAAARCVSLHTGFAVHRQVSSASL
jgi:hypothetical protein